MTHLLQTAARGRKGGRPKAATPNKVAGAHSLIASGITVREAAARLKIGSLCCAGGEQGLRSGIEIGMTAVSPKLT